VRHQKENSVQRNYANCYVGPSAAVRVFVI
jgi:hypothetical protein